MNKQTAPIPAKALAQLLDAVLHPNWQSRVGELRTILELSRKGLKYGDSDHDPLGEVINAYELNIATRTYAAKHKHMSDWLGLVQMEYSNNGFYRISMGDRIVPTLCGYTDPYKLLCDYRKSRYFAWRVFNGFSGKQEIDGTLAVNLYDLLKFAVRIDVDGVFQHEDPIEDCPELFKKIENFCKGSPLQTMFELLQSKYFVDVVAEQLGVHSHSRVMENIAGIQENLGIVVAPDFIYLRKPTEQDKL